MILDCFDVNQFLDRVIQDVVSVYLQKESLGICYQANLGVPESAHEKKVNIGLPLSLVIPLNHTGFDVWSQQPVVAARIEVVRIVGEWLSFAKLSFCKTRPLVHQLTQVEIVVDGIVVEFFLVDLLALVLERKVQPVKYVEHFYGLREELEVYLCSLYNVQSENILELHDDFMHEFFWHDGDEFNCRDVLCEIGNLSFFVRDVAT